MANKIDLTLLNLHNKLRARNKGKGTFNIAWTLSMSSGEHGATGPVKSLLIVDGSDSMEGSSIRTVREGIDMALQEAFQPQDSVAISIFSSPPYQPQGPKIIQPWTPGTRLTEVRNNLTLLKPNGGTDYAHAFRPVIDQMKKAGTGKPIAVFMSDGDDFGNHREAINLAESIREAGIELFVAGFNVNAAAELHLRAIGKDNYKPCKTPEDLKEFFLAAQLRGALASYTDVYLIAELIPSARENLTLEMRSRNEDPNYKLGSENRLRIGDFGPGVIDGMATFKFTMPDNIEALVSAKEKAGQVPNRSFGSFRVEGRDSNGNVVKLVSKDIQIPFTLQPLGEDNTNSVVETFQKDMVILRNNERIKDGLNKAQEVELLQQNVNTMPMSSALLQRAFAKKKSPADLLREAEAGKDVRTAVADANTAPMDSNKLKAMFGPNKK